MDTDIDLLSFNQVAQFNVPTVGCIHVVKNPRPCTDFLWLEKKEVTVDGRKFVVAGVRAKEDATYSSAVHHYEEGEFIGLVEVTK